MTSIDQVKIPFLNTSRVKRGENSYCEMLRNVICPNFNLVSISSLLILLNIVFFIVPRTLASTTNYKEFLSWPQSLSGWALDVQQVRSNKAYIYETFSAMFMHESYKHIAGNMIFAFFILYEIQYCWKWNIGIALLSGWIANCLAVVCIDGRVLGFSGALSGALGVQIGVTMIHCSYLRSKYGNQFYFQMAVNIMLLIMVIGSGSSALIHFFGFLYGFLISCAFCPRMGDANVNPIIDKLLMIFSIGFIAIAIFLCMIV